MLAILGIPGIGMPELIIILVIILVLFGPKRLPQLGKSLGKTVKSLRDGMDGKEEIEGTDESVPAAPPKAPEQAEAEAAKKEPEKAPTEEKPPS
jgi:sec-independent protein translocase protein TatA